VAATDLENVFVCEISAAGNVMVELDRRPIGFVLGLELEGLAFRRPVAIIEKCDRVAANAAAKILIPKFPKDLFEGRHKNSLIKVEYLIR
jgi:hypothetical protein